MAKGSVRMKTRLVCWPATPASNEPARESAEALAQVPGGLSLLKLWW